MYAVGKVTFAFCMNIITNLNFLRRFVYNFPEFINIMYYELAGLKNDLEYIDQSTSQFESTIHLQPIHFIQIHYFMRLLLKYQVKQYEFIVRIREVLKCVKIRIHISHLKVSTVRHPN